MSDKKEKAIAEMRSSMLRASTPGMDKIKQMVADGAPIDTPDYRGRTMLDMAVRENNIELVRELIAMKADVNHTDDNGDSPLIAAAQNRYAKMVLLLIENGANIQYCNRGLDALFISDAGSERACADILLSHGIYIRTTRHPSSLNYHHTADKRVKQLLVENDITQWQPKDLVYALNVKKFNRLIASIDIEQNATTLSDLIAALPVSILPVINRENPNLLMRLHTPQTVIEGWGSSLIEACTPATMGRVI